MDKVTPEEIALAIWYNLQGWGWTHEAKRWLKDFISLHIKEAEQRGLNEEV